MPPESSGLDTEARSLHCDADREGGSTDRNHNGGTVAGFAGVVRDREGGFTDTVCGT